MSSQAFAQLNGINGELSMLFRFVWELRADPAVISYYARKLTEAFQWPGYCCQS